MSKGIIVSPANRGVQVVVTDENNVQLLVDSNRGVNLEIVPQPRIEVLVDKGVEGAQGPVGPQGPQGPQGTAATVTAGTTTTGAAGTNAIVTNSGTSSAAVFDFTIPRGDTGATGAGVATGGTTGQFLQKASNANYDTTWATITGTLVYQGSWNASTNTPTLTSSVGTNGYYYVVGTSGSTNLNGITDWVVGDWAIFNGSVWQKIDNTDLVSSVNGQTGVVVLDAADVGALSEITSTDGSVTITSPNATTRDLSVAVSGATTNVLCLVRNTTGATLTKGTVVYISGATGQNPTVSKALATSDATSAQTLGMMTADLANNSNGYVTVIGLITNIDTSAYTDGQQLYLSGTTAGAVTGTKPYAPIHLVYVAVVEHAHPTQGKLFVKVQNGYELDEIHNVSAQTPSNGQTIVYNSSTQLWQNNTVSLGIGVNGTLPVANGGTGATTLTGYVKGNGTSAFTASATVPSSDITGLGTMSTQNANAVAITGGTIDNTTVGATTPSTGVFTTLTATGQTSLGGAADAEALRAVTTASAINWVQVSGATNGNAPSVLATGANTSVFLDLASKGTAGGIRFKTAVSTEQMRVSHTASAVNYVQVTGAATGGTPTISAQGSDTNIPLTLNSKGNNGIIFQTRGAGTPRVALQLLDSGSASVNYLQIQSNISGAGPVLSALGTDTNISQVFQSKGTGAIDLAAGSSGVNISNGGTVTALTVTSAGSAYTTIPTPAITAPTTAGGVQATATATMSRATSTIVSGGTGYTLNDTITVSGGTFTTAASFTVSGVTGGVVNALTVANGGTYSVLPTGTLSTTGGTGTGLTLTIDTWSVRGLTITNAGSGYVEQPTVTFSGGGGSGAAAYATVGSGTLVKSIGATLDVSVDNTSSQAFRFYNSGGTGTAYWSAASGSTSPFLYAQGTANVTGRITSNGTGALALYTNGGSQLQFNVAHTASAVNYVQVTGAATGSGPIISAQGSDTDVRLNLTSKGTNSIDMLTNSAGTRQFRFSHTASAVNYLQATGAATGADPVLSAQGSDTNIDLVLSPKGTGALQAQQTDSTATGGNARGANAVDWQTNRNLASQVASGTYAFIGGGGGNAASGFNATIAGGNSNVASNNYAFVGGGLSNNAGLGMSGIVAGYANQAIGYLNFVGGGYGNSATTGTAITTQSGTMNGTTAVTLSGSNASIKVGQLIIGTSINSFPYTYVAAISGTSLTLSQAASGSSTSTLTFYTPHGVVVGGGNNQATGAYSFIGGGGDAGTAANRNVASGDWSVVGGGQKNVASGRSSVVVGGFSNTASTDGAVVVGGGFYAGTAFPNNASGTCSFIGGGFSNQTAGFGAVVVGGNSNIGNGSYAMAGGLQGTNRLLQSAFNFSSGALTVIGDNQYGIYLAKRQTTDATATVLTFDNSAAGTTNQVILPNNSAYYFKGTVIANVTGGGNTKGWTIEGAIKRGANAASTALVGTPTVVSAYADAGAATWAITATADTTNGGLAITFTGQAGTTIRVVAKLETTEVTF